MRYYDLTDHIDSLGDGFLFMTLGIVIFLLVIILVIAVVSIIGKWMLFKKAGKRGWEAIIPFYNNWVYVEIAGVNYWWFFLIIASVIFNAIGIKFLEAIAGLANLFALFVCNFNISKKLHKDVGFAILMTIFPFVMLPLVGISKNYQWDDSVLVSNNGPFPGSNSNNSNNYNGNESSNDEEYKYCKYCGNKIKKEDKYCNNCGKEI